MSARLLPAALAAAAALSTPAVLAAPGASAAQEQPALVEQVPVTEFAQLVATERVPSPRVDAIVVQDTDLSVDPAAVLRRVDTPVALIDGARATPHRWASLLCERLESGQA